MSLELIHELRLQKESAELKAKRLESELSNQSPNPESYYLLLKLTITRNRIAELSREIEEEAKLEVPTSNDINNTKRNLIRSLAELLKLLNEGGELGPEDIKRLRAAIKKGDIRLKDIKNLRAAEKKLGISINRQTRRVVL